VQKPCSIVIESCLLVRPAANANGNEAIIALAGLPSGDERLRPGIG
jgi:hypothetical protein